MSMIWFIQLIKLVNSISRGFTNVKLHTLTCNTLYGSIVSIPNTSIAILIPYLCWHMKEATKGANPIPFSTNPLAAPVV